MQRMIHVCELHLALVIALTEQLCNSAAEESGESVFTIEANLWRHLSAHLPEMIRAADQAALMTTEEQGCG